MHSIDVMELSPTLQEIDNLILEDRHTEAIRRLKAHVARTPDDPEALCLLARSYSWQAKYAEALDTAMTVLQARPDHLEGSCVAADVLIELGKAREALGFVERAIHAYDMFPLAEQRARGLLARRQWLYSIHWRALDALGEHEVALAVAREGYQVYSSMRSYVLDSLLALGRLKEAEQLDGPELEPDDYAFLVWNIGCTLMEQGKYAEALPYLRRNLAFVRLPNEFDRLEYYLEGLALGGQYEEVRQLCSYWLGANRIRYRPYRRYLQFMLALAQEGLGQKERALETVVAMCEGRTAERCFKLFRGAPHFDELWAALRRLLEEAVGAADVK
jgi:tetratricopeptide (TPR) repeat protein